MKYVFYYEREFLNILSNYKLNIKPATPGDGY